MIRRFWSDLLAMLRKWWNTDRIRVSPSEGQLLRLQPGDLLTIEGSDVEVIDRSIESSPVGEWLRLNCKSSAGDAILLVAIRAEITGQSPKWTQAGMDTPIDVRDIQVWPRSYHRALE